MAEPIARVKARLAIAESDLRDCTNPKVVEIYPHLGDPALKLELETKIAAYREQIERHDQ